MAIANRSTAEVQLLKKNLYNTLKAVENYDSDSRNPSMASATDTLIAALKVQVDATVADATPATDFPQAAT